MAFEDSITPRGNYLLGRFMPFTRTAGGLHVPTKGEAQTKGGRLVVLKCGPSVENIRPGQRILISQNWAPTMLGDLDGYRSDDGSVLFLYPADQVIATMDEDIAEAALLTES